PYAIAHAIKDSGSTIVSVDAEKPSFPCPLHSTRAKSHHGNSSPPCNNGDCPFCPCPCCAPMHAAMGILSQEAAQADYAPLISAFAPPPTLLCPLARFANFAGQPRAPPVLI